MCYVAYKFADTGVICIASLYISSFYGDPAYPSR